MIAVVAPQRPQGEAVAGRREGFGVGVPAECRDRTGNGQLCNGLQMPLVE